MEFITIMNQGKLLWVLFSLLYYCVQADFIFEDFNQTLGLNINGDAATSGCNINETYITKYDGEQANINSNNIDINNTAITGKSGDLQTRQTIITNENESYNDSQINELEAQFGHRDTYAPGLNKGCRRRLRLTPSSPSKAGSVFYEKRVPVVS